MTLAEYLTANITTPFAWGENDCVLFANRWAIEATGVDHLADVTKWENMLEAQRILRRMGGLVKILDTRLPRVHPNLAQDGDIALCRNAICIFSGSQIVGLHESGLHYVSRMDVEAAWSIRCI